MAINKAMYTGTAAVMDWFDRNATSPYYSVWADRKQLLFSWNDEDEEAGRSKLEADITALEENGVSDLLVLKLHPAREKSGYVTDKSPIYGSIKFRPSIIEQSMYASPARVGYDNGMQSVLQQLAETQKLILAKLSNDELEEELEMEEPKKDFLSGLMENEQVQAMIIAGVTRMFAGGQGQASAIAGVNDNEAVAILNSLMSKGVTIEHLRKLDEMGSMKLQSLLMML